MKLLFSSSFPFHFPALTKTLLFFSLFSLYLLSFNDWSFPLVCWLLRNREFRLQERDFSFWQIFHTLLHCLTEMFLGSKLSPETSVWAHREEREDEHCRISTNHNPRTGKEASITTNPCMLNCVSQMPVKTKY